MNDYKQKVESMIAQGRFIQAFDIALAAYLEEDIPEYKREKTRKYDVLRVITATAGYSWDELIPRGEVFSLFETVLDPNESIKRRDLVAAMILRIQGEGLTWFDQTKSKIRPKVVDFLLRSIDNALIDKIWKIDRKGMKHETIAKFSEESEKVTKGFHKAIKSCISLGSIKPCKSKIMKAINHPSGKVIIQPFLPPNITSELDETFIRLEQYLESRDEWNVVDSYDNAHQQLERLTALLEQHGSCLSVSMAEDFSRHLTQVLEEDFQSNRAAQPAKVEISERTKKYPLQNGGIEIQVGIFVQNRGPGYANDVTLACTVDPALQIAEESKEIRLGRLAPGIKQNIEIPFKIIEPTESAGILILISWTNFDGEQKEGEFEFTIQSQRTGVDWSKLISREPYSLEPITSDEELIGRKDVLDRLTAIFRTKTIGSAHIQGQKRVGKTSIARAVESRLKKEKFQVCFIDSGDYVDPDASKTVSNLGNIICKRLQRLDSRIKHIQVPRFEQSLSPLTNFLEDIQDIIPDARIVIIIDEFDELPLNLYQKNALGNSFFLSLRSLSSRKGIGFLLIGGEKMKYIMDYQGTQLNKWKLIKVDYFSRSKDWADYQELVQKPVEGAIDFDENAINMTYEFTAGNPFFTNLICGYVFQNAVQRRDTYVSTSEIRKAVTDATNELASNTFQHFWDDGILAVEDEALLQSIQRRKVLIGVAEALESNLLVNAKTLSENELLIDLSTPTINDLLREFLNRDVFIRDSHNNYRFKVELFYQWLVAKGINDLIATFPELDASLRKKQAEQEKRISATEIVDLVESWGLYKGHKITEDRVRDWLEQFGAPTKQRLMFTILQNLTFYSNSEIRAKMKEIESIVRRDLTRRLEPGQRKRADILVSYLDAPAKSGAHLARLFADVAGIYVDNVIEKGKISAELASRDDIQAIVFIDDFVGTGNSAIEYIKEIFHDLESAGIETFPKLVFASVVAYVDGWAKLQNNIASLKMPIELHTCEILDKRHQCFSDDSAIFMNQLEREQAQEIATEIGFKLEKRNPLGYGNLQLALVFEHGCPNNSLPILWDESSSNEFKWRPLFKRH